MTLTLISATLGWQDADKCLASWSIATIREWKTIFMENYLTGDSLLQSYQRAYELSSTPIIAFVHDDLIIQDPLWYERIMAEFNDPTVGIVGLAGAIGHGTPDLYTSPYHLPNLARQDFISNMRDAEVHGRRLTGSCDVAVLDGMAIFIRREILEKCGGWDMNWTYFMYTEGICCEARRQGYRIRVVGCSCDHLGGKSSTMVQLTDSYEEAHRYFYENNRDVMPFRAGGGR
jgi:GT2 family glycosyltransferase